MLQKKSNRELPNEDVELTTHKKRYISPKERQNIIDELRLIPKKIHIDELRLTLKEQCVPLKKGRKLFNKVFK